MNYELLVDELLETIKVLRKKLGDSKYACNYWYKQTEELQEEAEKSKQNNTVWYENAVSFQKQVEELQSKNNDLQTGIEWLQSSNSELLETNKELQSKLTASQNSVIAWNGEFERVNQFAKELQSEKTNLLLHRNSLQAENNKLILERDELQSKNNDLKKLLKDRGVIVIDDSIVREEPK